MRPSTPGSPGSAVGGRFRRDASLGSVGWRSHKRPSISSVASSEACSTLAAGNRIQVAVRARPLNARELDLKNNVVWRYEGNCVEELEDDGRTRTGKRHTYDNVFPENTTTAEVYELQCKAIVQGALDGYNGTIFAYGQTSSGKTYTLMGDLQNNPGVNPRAIEDIFKWVEAKRDAEWSILVSYMEIYNETITDLLQPDAAVGTNLKITEDKTFGPTVRDLTEVKVHNAASCMSKFSEGEKRRSYRSTDMNVNSSRSHTLFRVRIDSRNSDSGAMTLEACEIMRNVASSFVETQEQLFADRASLYIVDRENGELHIQSGEIVLSLPMSQGIAGAVATTGKTVNIPDAYKDSRFNASVDKKTGYTTKSILAMPVFDSGGQVVGVVQFINKKEPADASFDEADEECAGRLTKEIGPLIRQAQTKTGTTVMSLLNLVDLAGSERAKKTNSSGSTLREGANINLSLMTLGQVISVLAEGKFHHIPFRNSKLTQLLSTSLGGNANTCIICNISPASRNRSETLSTLQFASRAKKVVNHVQKIIKVDQSGLVRAYEDEIAKLKEQLLKVQSIGALPPPVRLDSDSFPGGTPYGNDAFQVDITASESFTQAFRQLDAETLEAEEYANALLAPGALPVRIKALVAVNEAGIGRAELKVVAARCEDEEIVNGVFPSEVEKELINVKEFRQRLAWMRRSRDDASEYEQKSVLDAIEDGPFDMWTAATRAAQGMSGSTPPPAALRRISGVSSGASDISPPLACAPRQFLAPRPLLDPSTPNANGKDTLTHSRDEDVTLQEPNGRHDRHMSRQMSSNDVYGSDDVKENQFFIYARDLAVKLSDNSESIRKDILRFMEEQYHSLSLGASSASSFLPFQRTTGDTLELVIVDIEVKRSWSSFSVCYRSSSSPLAPPHKELAEPPLTWVSCQHGVDEAWPGSRPHFSSWQSEPTSSPHSSPLHGSMAPTSPLVHSTRFMPGRRVMSTASLHSSGSISGALSQASAQSVVASTALDSQRERSPPPRAQGSMSVPVSSPGSLRVQVGAPPPPLPFPRPSSPLSGVMQQQARQQPPRVNNLLNRYDRQSFGSKSASLLEDIRRLGGLQTSPIEEISRLKDLGRYTDAQRNQIEEIARLKAMLHQEQCRAAKLQEALEAQAQHSPGAHHGSPRLSPRQVNSVAVTVPSASLVTVTTSPLQSMRRTNSFSPPSKRYAWTNSTATSSTNGSIMFPVRPRSPMVRTPMTPHAPELPLGLLQGMPVAPASPPPPFPPALPLPCALNPVPCGSPTVVSYRVGAPQRVAD